MWWERRNIDGMLKQSKIHLEHKRFVEIGRVQLDEKIGTENLIFQQRMEEQLRLEM